MSIGHEIIDEIVRQGMFTVSYPDPDAPHVFVWSSGAAEQLEALIAGHTVKLREALLLADCTLAELGADSNTPYRRVIADALLP